MDDAPSCQDSLRLALKAAREEANLTQAELADLAELSSRPIYVFESGKGSIRLDTYLKLLGALGLEVRIVPKAERASEP